MLDDELPDIAVRGEAGIDIFERLDIEGARRSRFRCLATLADDGTLEVFIPEARRDPATLRALAQGMADHPLLPPFSLGTPAGWPSATAGGDPVTLFLYLDFFRAWQVAEIAAARFEAQLARDPALPLAAGQLAGAVTPLYDFNRLARGQRLARALLGQIATAGAGLRDDQYGGAGYALRMLGDLCLRAGDPALALRCFEASVAAGDNPFRRRKAIEAARLLGDREAAARHRAGYAARWKLPADLAETGDAA